jgi:thiamine pyrophosphokinase
MQKKNRAVIVCAAQINNYNQIKKNLRSDDFFIFCDGGLNHCMELNVVPDLILGDFDSYTEKKIENIKTEFSKADIIILPKEKDDTDSMYAAKKVLEAGFTEVLMIGSAGNRFDHTMVNVSLLRFFYSNEIKAQIIDDCSVIQFIGQNKIEVSPEFSYFSIIVLSDKCSGVTITNAKYPLKDAKITGLWQYAVSNEVLDKAKSAEVSIKKGSALLVMDF